METSPVPIIAHIRPTSSRMIIVVAVVPGGGTNVPCRMASAVSVSAEYPNSSNSAPWQIGALAARLNRYDISPIIPSSTSSFVVHTFIVPSLCGTSTFVGLGFRCGLTTLLMPDHTFF